MADLISSYSEGKPSLIFTVSRRSAQFSADVLAKNTRFQFGWAQRQRLHDALAGISDTKLREWDKYVKLCILNRICIRLTQRQ